MTLYTHGDSNCSKESLHVFVEKDCWGSTPFCQCGVRRNPAYRRTWWDKLRGRPKRW